MDDLEEVWGPRGRATVDPGSIRPVIPAPTPAAPAVPAAPAAPIGEIVPSGLVSEWATGPRRRPAIWIGAGTTALAVAVLVTSLGVRSSSETPAPVVATGSTATTIVSAAADLLGRSKVTVPAAAPSTPSTPSPGSAPTPTLPANATTTVPASSSAPAPAPASATEQPPLALAEERARQFIDAITRRDCEGLWAMFSRGTQAFLNGSTEPGEPSGRDALCEGLRSEEVIPPMRVHGPAELRDGRATVPLESEGEVEELAFVAENGRWVIDLFGDLGEESAESNGAPAEASAEEY